VIVNASGTLRFTPANGFAGIATITYSISDGNGGTASAAARVNVLQGNRPPVAQDDIATTPEDTAVTIPALANDSDLTAIRSPSPARRSPRPPGQSACKGPRSSSLRRRILTVRRRSLTPSAMGGGGTASATATVSVSSVNDAPIANNDVASTTEEASVTTTVTSNDSDIDGDTLTVTSATLTSGQGSVAFSGGNVTFTPAVNFHGTATIGYTISDGNGGQLRQYSRLPWRR
jgi:hypothetical protein